METTFEVKRVNIIDRIIGYIHMSNWLKHFRKAQLPQDNRYRKITSTLTIE